MTSQHISVKDVSETVSIVKSACRMCHGGCGVLVHVQDGKVMKLEGDPDSPLSRGEFVQREWPASTISTIPTG